jgi:hypothetical protein
MKAITARQLPFGRIYLIFFLEEEALRVTFKRHQHQIRLIHWAGRFSFPFRRSVGVGAAAIFLHRLVDPH